jgi:hypothetical protein
MVSDEGADGPDRPGAVHIKGSRFSSVVIFPRFLSDGWSQSGLGLLVRPYRTSNALMEYIEH